MNVLLFQLVLQLLNVSLNRFQLQFLFIIVVEYACIGTLLQFVVLNESLTFAGHFSLAAVKR